MRTLKLTIAYDGTRYAGWQVQTNTRKPTIQGVLQAAFRQILGERVAVIGSGRTDAGVHALGQVAHLQTQATLSCQRLQRALNHRLPKDIVVTKLEGVRANFHAQFQATRKRYAYRIVTGPVVLPFERLSVHQVWVPLNVALMRQEASVLKGEHNFRSFHAAGRPVKDTRRTIRDIRIRQQQRDLTIEIEADGFLYKMVRNIVGTLLEIGRGHRPPGTMARLLKARDRRLAGSTAPARGLCLLAVHY